MASGMRDVTTSSAPPRWMRAIGLAATALAGAAAMAITAPHAKADPAYQPALDQLLEAMLRFVTNEEEAARSLRSLAE